MWKSFWFHWIRNKIIIVKASLFYYFLKFTLPHNYKKQRNLITDFLFNFHTKTIALYKLLHDNNN